MDQTSKESTHAGTSENDSDDEEMSFIVKRFMYLAKKNKRFYGRSNDFRGSSSRKKKDDHKGCFNCKKLDHFIVDCLEVQMASNRGRSIRGSSSRAAPTPNAPTFPNLKFLSKAHA
ncbi:hypothetical protein KIW84_010917 [Lathyrus oleraceus]|uniref:CCHC-type domain-containing protein n=1 Tax=Pisum sativum TaxID=3888 RepID=A0A9D4YMG8_PEA|nr:hypothetical protein KIW84_010917 [Pisum sativum]